MLFCLSEARESTSFTGLYVLSFELVKMAIKPLTGIFEVRANSKNSADKPVNEVISRASDEQNSAV